MQTKKRFTSKAKRFTSKAKRFTSKATPFILEKKHVLVGNGFSVG
jgi:hypothetical protein